MFTKTRTRKNDLERRAFWSLIGALVVFFFLYLFFVSSSVVHVVLREEIKKDIAETNAEIAILEAQYLAITEAIDEDFAERLGYVPIAKYEKHFATRKTTVLGLLE